MRRKKQSCLPAFLTIVLLLLSVGIVMVLAKILTDAAVIYGQPAGTLSFFDKLSLSINLLSHQEDLFIPLNPNGSQVSFTIAPAEPVGEIAGRMRNEGLIPDAQAWVDYLVYRGYDISLKAGNYRLSPANNPVQIAEWMQAPGSQEVVFSILPGWRLEEIAASLPTSGLAFSPEEFLAVTQSGDFSVLSGRLPAGIRSLEGTLFPGQYLFSRAATLQEVLITVLERFFQTLDGESWDSEIPPGLDLYQAITLASIVEREAVIDDEKPQIASVFLNRLAAGMGLGSDPTVQYAIGFDPAGNTWWKTPLTASDLAVDSPYNTRLYSLFPPTPICNPGEAALRAVFQPAESTYYFFRALCDGSGRHIFAETNEEHIRNACE